MIEIVRDDSVETFLKEASPLLYKFEAANSLMLGLSESLLTTPQEHPPLLIRIVENGQTVSAAIQTPPRNLVITISSRAILDKLSKFLKEINADFPGVVGPAQESELFASFWAKLNNKKSELGMGHKIYKLDKVNPLKKPVAGEFVLAQPKDLEMVTKSIMNFTLENLPSSDHRDEAHWKEYSERAIKTGSAHLWVVDGKPVSAAFVSRATKNSISINAVYTPHEYRKNGYASAVVTNLSQKMLDSGKKYCVLYTDLANTSSNKMYQKIGYHEVTDSKHFLFF